MSSRRWTFVGVGLVAVGLLAACGGPAGDPDEAATPPGTTDASVPAGSAAAVTPAAREEAQQIFDTRCTVCHGSDGRGDGPGASALDPKPRDYHDAEWQQTVTDEEIETAIVYGGAAVGQSPLMVGNPDLTGKPAVVAALREIIRDFGEEP